MTRRAGKEKSRGRQRLGSKPSFTLRPARAGDLGWIVHRHGVLYAEEQGYDMRFEALVSRIVGEFFQRNDSERERCWIAERQGKNIGCVFVFRKSTRVAKLRMLLVEPSARGMGLGSRLIEECIRFARQAGYRKMTLWTHQSLRAARRLYRAAGFRLVKSVSNPSFGRKLVDEFWDLEL
jgi:GNAT superfamily N-acetyltransferase